MSWDCRGVEQTRGHSKAIVGCGDLGPPAQTDVAKYSKKNLGGKGAMAVAMGIDT